MRHINPGFQAGGVYIREARLDGLGRHVRGNIQQHIAVSVRLHLRMDGSRHHIPRGQVPPLGSVPLHERHTLRRQQHPAFAPHVFTDQKALGSRNRQRCGMKLHILRVDDPRPGPMRHCQPVSPGAGRVGGIAVNAPHAAGRQDGLGCQGAMNGPPVLVKHVGPIAGHRAVSVQRIAGVMRISDQVHRSGAGQQLNVGAVLHRRHQSLNDGLARAIANMQNSAAGMGRFFGIGQAAIWAVVKMDPAFVNQQVFQQFWPLTCQNCRRRRVGGPRPRVDNIGRQQFWSVCFAAVDDAPLGVV